MSTAAINQQKHRNKATLVRKNHIVKDCANGTTVFDGIQNAKDKLFPWCEGFKGINAAKRHIRASGAVSYTL
jgi:hypothetical protein